MTLVCRRLARRPSAFYRHRVDHSLFDVIVIGAGAAGLMATAELARSGRSVLLLEARNRIGGRIWTRREPGLAVPVEFGAEFIHGHANITRGLLARVGQPAVEASGTHLSLRDGVLGERSSNFPRIRSALTAARALLQEDMSFDALLDQHLAGVLSVEERQYARMLAQGFDAADTARASARAIVDEWSGDTLGDAPQARPQNGYESLLTALAPQLDSPQLRLQLQSVVQNVRWEKDSVHVEGEFLGARFQARAARAIVTVPLGVLQAEPPALGSLRFTPALEAKQAALRGLASGAIVKVLLRFAASFWETVEAGRYRDASFFHAPLAQFPTFWTPAPMRAPLLVAWAGGPRALELRAQGTQTQLVRTALTSLQTLFGGSSDVQQQLVAFYYHDWEQDPFARGAYSYVTVGGGSARAELGRPVENTLFFAGEATDIHDEAGTVTGALESGLRAAREVLAIR
jgi:monoamine oxidase